MFTATNRAACGPANYIAVFIFSATALLAGPRSIVPPGELGLENVSLYLNVEKNGGLMTGLRQENFHLFLDGNPVRFRLETPEQPASVVFLVEFSRSSGYYFEDMDAGVRSALKHAVEGHYYALATFAQAMSVAADFTSRPGEIVNAWSGLVPPLSNEVNTYDAIYEILDKMGRMSGRRILVVIGSGVDTFSEHTLDEVKKKAESVNVVVFAIGAGSAFRGAYEMYLNSSARMTLLQSRAFLQTLGECTGGFAWFPTHVNGFPDAVLGVMQSIGAQYRLVYQRPTRVSGKFHKLKVEAFRIVDDKREDFKVLVRSGWRE
jgi:VWFA-related protein